MGDDALPSPLAPRLRDHGHHGGLTAETLKPFIPVAAPPVQGECWGTISVRFASYNALTLATNLRGSHEEGLAFQPARPALLASQLLSAGINVAAIQEARTAEGSLRTGPFLRFCSGAVKGHFGVELWFHLGHKLWHFGSSPSAAVCFEADCFTVLAQDPRRLGVLFRKGSC